MTAPLLELENLTVSFPTPKGRVEVVKGLSFTSVANGLASWAKAARANP